MQDLCNHPWLLSTASATISVREWLQEWHDDHDVAFDPDVKFEIAWDGRWINDSSAEELESDLVNWGCNLATSKRIAKDLTAMKGAKKANMGEGENIQEISYVGDKQHALCVSTWWFWGALIAALFAIALLVSALAFIGDQEDRLLECLGG